MSTINISLPKEQVSLVDRLTKMYKFANRSEFLRSLLRLIEFKPDLISHAATFPFIAPKEKSQTKIMAGFTKTGKYSHKFLRDLQAGLKDSDYFVK